MALPSVCTTPEVLYKVAARKRPTGYNDDKIQYITLGIIYSAIGRDKQMSFQM